MPTKRYITRSALLVSYSLSSGTAPRRVILAVALVFALCGPVAVAQGVADGLWTDVAESAVATGAERFIVPDQYRTVQLNTVGMDEALAAAPLEAVPLDTRDGIVLSLPTPDGEFEAFRVIESPVMAPELQAKYPEIRSYYGRSINRPGVVARISWTPDGFRALVLGEETYLIDPMQKGDIEHYVVYRKADYTPDPKRVREAFKDEEVIDEGGNGDFIPSGGDQQRNGGTFREYRLAVATTGEYTAFHGGTVADGLAAINVAMTRVNGIYERDLSVRMVLIANNDQIVYTDPATDPYTNDEGPTMLGENQANLDAVIGAANYDIGHVFSTGGGGIASLGSVCRTNVKGRGVTGQSEPENDAFYVDYVAHEIGHQYGANHTFNGDAVACNANTRNDPTAFEPGSGSTIMAYANICGSHDLQTFSDDYFHAASLGEIVDFITDSAGSTCGMTSATGNEPPVVSVEDNGVTIPIETPFILRGSATDDGGTGNLTYTWEELDLGPAGPPPGVPGWSMDPPLFRSFSPTAEPIRHFPQLDRILANQDPVIGEGYPMDTRTLTFRLTARDNAGGIGDADVQIMTDQSAGPFRVTFANTPDLTFNSGLEYEITWDVAGTAGGAVNTPSVDILLSTDNGVNFSEVLASVTPNDGSEMITIPDVGSVTEARIMIRAVGNIFFDVNDEPFAIEPSGASIAYVIDRSGSMGGAPIFNAKNAAVQGIYGMREGDEVSVVSFSSSANVSFPREVITGDATRASASNAVQSLFASGLTSIGAGLQAAYNQLVDSDLTQRNYVLLSDGEENTPPLVEDVIGLFDNLRTSGLHGDGFAARGSNGVSNDIVHRIHAIAYGTGADEQLLADIAAQTGGLFLYAPDRNDPLALSELFDAIQSEVTGAQRLDAFDGTLQAPDEALHEFTVGSDVSEATVKLLWGDVNADLDLELTKPDGTVIASGDGGSDVSEVSGPGIQYFVLSAPMAGTWQARVKAMSTAGPTNYAVSLTAQSSVRMVVDLSTGPYSTGTPLTITATLTEDDASLAGATVEAIITPPSAVRSSIAARIQEMKNSGRRLGEDTFENVAQDIIASSSQEASSRQVQRGASGDKTDATYPALRGSSEVVLMLYDDGAHNDGAAGDGIYGAVFVPSVVGTHTVTVTAQGNLTDGGTFTRASSESFFAEQGVEDSVAPACGPIALEFNNGNYEVVSSATDNVGITSATITRLTSNLDAYINGDGPFTEGDIITLPGAPASVDLLARVRELSGRITFLVTVADATGNESVCDPVITDLDGALPQETALGAAYPNPTHLGRGSVTVPFTVAEPMAVRIAVYDVLGREVAVLADDEFEAGSYEVEWAESRALPAGLYLIRFHAGTQRETQRITLVR